VCTRLAPLRRLPADLGLPHNTAARAYRDREDSGLRAPPGRPGTSDGAAADRTLERARAAARQYADLVTSLGLAPDVALRIVRAALGST